MSRKLEILEAVISKFEKEGFATDLTISDIANRVDIGKSTIYEYFKTKDDMCKEAIFLIIQRSIDGIILVEDIENMDFEQAFKAQLKNIYIASAKGRMTMQILSRNLNTKLPPEFETELKSKMEEVAKFLEKRFIEILFKGIKENKIKMNTSIESEILFSSIVVGSLMRYSGKYYEIPVDDYVNIIFDQIVKLSN
ncbi:MAG: TetR/AcrR family transcriptional regulator [Bacilli bacterium]|nr:TetR/AcrR family transcriptional regulator [Bacilli bacterium]